MRSLFLTPEELVKLTGYVQAAAQVRWLKANRLVHYVRADGRPAVPVSAIDANEKAPAPGRIGPDLDAVRVRH